MSSYIQSPVNLSRSRHDQNRVLNPPLPLFAYYIKHRVPNPRRVTKAPSKVIYTMLAKELLFECLIRTLLPFECVR